METVIRAASDDADYAAFGRLVGEHVGWMAFRYRGDEQLIAAVLDQQSFADELERLSTIYGRPGGQAFLASAGGEFRGCGAYRRLDDTTCEMKRVFVPERFRGAGLGRRLCQAVIDAATREGYERIRLDTLDRMTEAAAMYRAFGFHECAPYQSYPEALMSRIVFMELRL